MVPVSHIELNLKALKQNITYLKNRIGNSVFVSVIKGNAYGHGIEYYLPLAEECGVKYFAISDSTEAERAFKVKKKETKLIILNAIDNKDLDFAIEKEIGYYVFNFDRLYSTVEVAKKINKKAKIHIELETGLNRTGFSKDEIKKVIEIIGKNREYFHIEGVCTHFAGAESIANYLRIQNQKELFKEIKFLLEENNIKPDFYHSACSAAALTYPDTTMDMVRFGIAQYGFWPSKETRMYNLLSDKADFTRDPLNRVLSWKSKVISIKHVPAGEFIGYGNNYLANTNMRIAIIPIGYYHGYSRSLSNLGYVLIKNSKAPVVGMVNMNMLIVDVTHIKDVIIEDEVVLIGKQGKHSITIASFAELSNYVNYELLVRLPYEIPRVVIR
ncbi:MAG: alanine racemase [bacterium]